MADAQTHLKSYLSEHDAACPNCEYNLRGLQDTRCPECNEELVLKVGLAEPKLAAWTFGLVGLGMSTGFCVIVLLWGMFMYFRSRGPQIDELLPLIVGTLFGGALLAFWTLSGRRILSRLGPNGRWPCALGIVAISVPCIVWFFQRAG